MRIAFVSDIHGNLPALEAVVADIARRSVDQVVNLGDSVSGPLLPLETARYLMAQKDWIQLAGNHERQVLTLPPEKLGPSDIYARALLGPEEREWMASLKHCLRMSDEVLLCHGTPRSDHEYFLETVEPSQVRLATLAEIDERLEGMDAKLIACGHTHVPRAVRASCGALIVNPGSVGLPAYDDDHPYFHVIQNGSPDARYAIAERGELGWCAELICVPYDYQPMADLAQRNGRPEWARAIATGYL